MVTTQAKQRVIFQQSTYRRFRAVLKERTRPVVLWCGAGLSVPAGLPDWSGLKGRLLADLEAKAISFPDPERSRLLGRVAAIEEEGNAWLSFTQLQQDLGSTSFKNSVREHLSIPKGASIPFQYSGFWAAGIRGVINLNLDRLATSAYAEVRGRSVSELQGTSIHAAPAVVGSGKDFVLNLHGILEDSRSWILTHSELADLQRRSAYKTTLSAVFTNFGVLFAGISADDVASSGFLASLTSNNIDLSDHYWLTSRNDAETDTWAEKEAGLQVIRYAAADAAEHELSYKAIFDDLAAFVPQDDVAPAIRSQLVMPAGDILPSGQLASEHPEAIRSSITAFAQHLLDQSDGRVTEKYRVFLTEYARPIHNAWYVSTTAPDNKFFGYELQESLGEGAFSNVFRALAPNGEECAIKIMHESLASDDVMLSCFRRGINSMRILEKHDLDGMIKMFDAVELPAAIFMEMVHGPTLEQAVVSRLIEPWVEGLPILMRVAEIVRNGHSLPERVLHRDLRPSNIMLRNFYDSEAATEVVVLDFDLSWHRGAFDVTMKQHAQAALGYLAPEQIIEMDVSTRNAAVDTHGFCAMIYFVFTGKHPTQGQFQSNNFQDQLKRDFEPAGKLAALCAGNRLRRLLTAGVAMRQSVRPDFGEVLRELRLLYQALTDIAQIDSPDFWAEELMCRTRGESAYRFQADNQAYEAQLVSGVALSLIGNFTDSAIKLHISYAARGDEDRRNVIKYLQSRVPEVVKALETAGFEVEKGSESVWQLSYSIRAQIRLSAVRDNYSSVVNILKRSLDRLAMT